MNKPTQPRQHGIPRRDFMKGALAGGAGLSLAGGARNAAADDAAADAPAATVPRKALGNTGMTIPIILMGGSQKFDSKYDRLLHRAHKMGVDYIDTAAIYAGGQSQKTIAPFLGQVGRDKVWVTSKAALYGAAASPEGYKKHLDGCLEALQTDYLDMFFMHMIDDLDRLEPDFIKMGDDIKKSGKAKLFGFSCHDGNVAKLMQKAAAVGGIDAIMFRYNFHQYGDKELNDAIDACKAKGIGLIAMKTQASIPDDQEKVVEFKSKNWTLGQAKLKSVWADERIDAAVSHIDNLQLLEENTAAAISPAQLTMDEYHQLNRLARLTAPYTCLGCNHLCESKVDGKLKIAAALRYLMYEECYHDPETARMLYHALEPAERDFDGVDLAAATAACPQDIQIAARLQKAREHLMA